MPKKNNRQKRRPNPVLHIFCEGEKTEPNYLNGYIDECCPGIRSMRVIRVEPTKKNTPKQLVDEAARMRRRSPIGDQFWVAYDRESEVKYPSSFHAQAHQKAEKNGIQIALSNICFEVWVLLHFTQSIAPFTCYDELLKRSSLKTFFPDYNKASRDIFKRLKERTAVARINASKLNTQTRAGADPQWTRQDQWNPYTNIYELLDAIDEFSNIKRNRNQ